MKAHPDYASRLEAKKKEIKKNKEQGITPSNFIFYSEEPIHSLTAFTESFAVYLEFTENDIICWYIYLHFYSTYLNDKEEKNDFLNELNLTRVLATAAFIVYKNWNDYLLNDKKESLCNADFAKKIGIFNMGKGFFFDSEIAKYTEDEIEISKDLNRCEIEFLTTIDFELTISSFMLYYVMGEVTPYVNLMVSDIINTDEYRSTENVSRLNQIYGEINFGFFVPIFYGRKLLDSPRKIAQSIAEKLEFKIIDVMYWEIYINRFQDCVIAAEGAEKYFLNKINLPRILGTAALLVHKSRHDNPMSNIEFAKKIGIFDYSRKFNESEISYDLNNCEEEFRRIVDDDLTVDEYYLTRYHKHRQPSPVVTLPPYDSPCDKIEDPKLFDYSLYDYKLFSPPKLPKPPAFPRAISNRNEEESSSYYRSWSHGYD